jgi:hypothetical protein
VKAKKYLIMMTERTSGGQSEALAAFSHPKRSKGEAWPTEHKKKKKQR